jgi:hypothetical protein
VLVTLLSGCRTDTSGLELNAEEPEAQGGSAGAAMLPAEPGSRAGGPDYSPAQVSSPPGAGSLVVLDGLVDGGRLFICLRDLGTDQALASGGPAPAGGLEFGQFQRFPLDWELAAADVEVELYRVAADVLAVQGCEALRQESSAAPLPDDADAGPDGGRAFGALLGGPRRAGSVTLARGSLFEGRHYALVATGCAAPEALPAPDACGPPDPLFGSRTELVLVEFGAESTEGGRYFGLQFLNASRTLGLADVSLQLEGPSDPSVPFVSGVSFGVLRPRVVATVEQPLALELRGRGAPAVAYSQLWKDTLAASSLELVPGTNYLLASIGPSPQPDGQGFSALRLVLISAQ